MNQETEEQSMKLSRFFTVLIVLIIGMLLLSGCKPKPENTNQNQNQNQNAEDGENSDDSGVKGSDNDNEDVEEKEVMTWISFKSDEFGFTLSIPSTWIIVDTESYGILLRPYEGTQTSFYVDTDTSIFKDDPAFTITDHIEEMMNDLRRIRSESTFEDASSLEINGHSFSTLNYSRTGTDELTYYAESYFTATKDLGFEMYYVADEDEFETYKDILRQIASSFKFLS